MLSTMRGGTATVANQSAAREAALKGKGSLVGFIFCIGRAAGRGDPEHFYCLVNLSSNSLPYSFNLPLVNFLLYPPRLCQKREPGVSKIVN